MKRKITLLLTSVLAVCVLMTSLVTLTAFAETDGGSITVSVEQSEVKPGDSVVAVVTMAGNPGIVSANIDVNYDVNALTLTSVEDGNLLTGANLSSDYSASPYVLSWINNTATENFTSDGVLATLTFTVNESAEPGTTSISLNQNIINIDVDDVVFNLTGCEISITEADTQPASEPEPETEPQSEPEPQPEPEPETEPVIEQPVTEEPATTATEAIAPANNSNAKSATSDVAKSADNTPSDGTVQTGQSSFAFVTLAVMALAAAASYAVYYFRKCR